MASLGRGCIAPNLRPLLTPRSITVLPELHSCRQSFFTSALRWRAASPPKKAAKPSPLTTHIKANESASAAPSRYAFVKALATKPTPTVLYEGPSHRWFHFGCWSSGISILAWTALTGPTVIFQPADIPEWVSWVYGAAYTVLGAIGFSLISKTPNIVSLIRVLPGQAAPGVAKASATTPVPLRMELTVQRMFPWLAKPRVLTTSIDNVSLKSRFSLPEDVVPELRRREMEKLAREERRRFDMNHLLTMPFRRMGRAFVAMFEGVRAAFTGMGFGVIRVDSKEYKVNVTSGFAHDGFKTLEKVVPVKEK